MITEAIPPGAPGIEDAPPPPVALRGGRLVLPDRVLEGDLILRGGVIEAVTAPGKGGPCASHDISGLTVWPGAIDPHTHGGWGVDFAVDDAETIAGVAEQYARAGTTRVMITLAPAPLDAMLHQLDVAAKACGLTPAFIGIHLEGPFLCKDRRGALPEAGILPYDAATFEKLREAGGGKLRLMTFDPDAVAPDAIRRIQSTGVILSIGHTDASARTTREAIRAGARRTTHLCNAMPLIHHRDPGPVLPLLLEPHVRTEVIADGVHLDDDMLRLILRCREEDEVIFVSDSMPLAGLDPTTGTFAGEDVASDGTRAVRSDGTLAGSVAPLFPATERTGERLGLEPWRRAALRAANAAADLQLPGTGRIGSGMCADLVLVNEAGELISALRAGVRADRPGEDLL